MRKNGVGMLSYHQLVEEFSHLLEQNSIENKDNHPLSSLIMNTVKQIEMDYYPKYLLWFILVLLFVPILFLLKDNFILSLFIAFSWMVLSSIFIFVFSRIPTMKGINSLKLNASIVSDECKNESFTHGEAIIMLKNVVNVKDLKKETLLSKYSELIKSEIDDDSKKNTFSTPVDRILCMDLITDESKIKISKKEKSLLISFLLRIGSGSIKNHMTTVKSIKSIIEIENLKKDPLSYDPEKIKSYINHVLNAQKILRAAEKKTQFIIEELTKIDKISKK